MAIAKNKFKHNKGPKVLDVQLCVSVSMAHVGKRRLGSEIIWKVGVHVFRVSAMQFVKRVQSGEKIDT